MALKARALYNFQSENKEEISIQENEELVIFSENSLDGWLQGQNSRGETGLFPASYVEILRSRSGSNYTDYSSSPVGSPGHDSSLYSASPNPGISYQGSFEDDDDDDWDDWDDACTVVEEPQSAPGTNGHPSPSLQYPAAYGHHQHSGYRPKPVLERQDSMSSSKRGSVEDFIEKRKRRLILWMDHMTSHPVLSQYEGFQHFLCCRDEKQWKLGKRRAEKDEMVGASFLLTIQIPTEHQDLQDVEDRVDAFKAFSKKMDDSVLQLTNVASELVRKHVGGFRKEFQKLGNAFQAISHSFHMDPPYSLDALNNAISHTGKTYETVGEMFAEQPKNDLFLMLDTLSLYQGLLSNFPDIIHLQKGAFAKVKESQRMSDEGRMDQEEADGIRKRCRVVGFALQAEMNHFHERRVADFKRMMQSYLRQQIVFYQRVSQQLEKTLRMYDNL
ncbi:SNX33 protein, partial [Ptilorrhoa leucosticta]|nr:SNX33 protein [Ptilorrhoa leucosticta]